VSAAAALQYAERTEGWPPTVWSTERFSKDRREAETKDSEIGLDWALSV